MPKGSPLISTERTRGVVAPRPPQPHRAGGLAAAPHRPVGLVAAVVHPEDVVVGDHRVPAVAALRRRAVAGPPALVDHDPPGVAVQAQAEHRLRPDRDHAVAVGGEAGDARLGQLQRGRHRQQRLGVEHGERRGHPARRARRSPWSPARRRRGRRRSCGGAPTGSRCEASTSRPGLRRWAQRPNTMCRSPLRWAAIPPGQYLPPGSRGEEATVRERLRVEPLDPSLDRAGQRVAEGNVVPQRVELARLAADQQVGREGIAHRGEDEPLPRLDPQTGLPLGRAPAPRPAVLAGPRPRPVAAISAAGATEGLQHRRDDLGAAVLLEEMGGAGDPHLLAGARGSAR